MVLNDFKGELGGVVPFDPVAQVIIDSSDHGLQGTEAKRRALEPWRKLTATVDRHPMFRSLEPFLLGQKLMWRPW